MIAVQQIDDIIGVERLAVHVATSFGADGVIRVAAEISGYTVSVDGSFVQHITCDMTPEEYNAWGADDDYPTLLLIQKNGFSQ